MKLSVRDMAMMALGAEANKYFIPVKSIVGIKPTWDEEDEKMSARFAVCLVNYYHDGIMTRKEYKEVRDWLKSLKEKMKGE